MTDELTRFRADLPPADPAAMARARTALLRKATGTHRSRMWWQVGTTGATVTAMAAALFALPSAATRTQPANENGVVHNPDGTITIEFRELTDIRATNMEFYEAGIRAVILDSVAGGVVDCWTKYEVTPSNPANAPTDVVQPRPNPWGDELTFHPDRIPADMWLYIQAMVESPGNDEVQLRCDPNQQWEMSPNWVGDTTPGYPNLPPYQGTQPSAADQPPATHEPPANDQPAPTDQPTPGGPSLPMDQEAPLFPTR